MSIEESRDRLEQAEKEIRADQDRQSRLLTDEYKKLVKLAQAELDSVDGYTKLATPAHDYLEDTITLLKRYREGLESLSEQGYKWDENGFETGLESWEFAEQILGGSDD